MLSEKKTLEEKISDVEKKQTGWLETGLPGSLLGMVPGTDAYNLDKTIDTIKANIGFKELQDMRAASPTGGALGQIAVRELEFLQAAVGSLQQGQDQGQLRANLQSVRTHFENWKNAVTQHYQQQYGQQIPQGQQGQQGQQLFQAADEILRRGRGTR